MRPKNEVHIALHSFALFLRVIARMDEKNADVPKFRVNSKAKHNIVKFAFQVITYIWRRLKGDPIVKLSAEPLYLPAVLASVCSQLSDALCILICISSHQSNPWHPPKFRPESNNFASVGAFFNTFEKFKRNRGGGRECFYSYKYQFDGAWKSVPGQHCCKWGKMLNFDQKKTRNKTENWLWL